MCLHLWVICRVHVIDPVCAVAGRNRLMKRMTSCFYFWGYFSKFHMVWCQNVHSKSAFWGFTQTNFSIKWSGRARAAGDCCHGDIKACQKSPTRLWRRCFICGTMISIWRGFQDISTLFTYSSLQKHICMLLPTHHQPPNSRSYLYYPPITCCKTPNPAVPCSLAGHRRLDNPS